MQGPAPIPVFRPAYLSDGLEFQGHLVESPANVFYQSVKASRASIDKNSGAGRMQFQWRSVSDNLLMSPTVMLRFQLKITSPVVWNQVIQHIAVRGVRGPGGTQDNAYSAANAEAKSAGPPAICFAGCSCTASSCTCASFGARVGDLLNRHVNFNGVRLFRLRQNFNRVGGFPVE